MAGTSATKLTQSVSGCPASMQAHRHSQNAVSGRNLRIASGTVLAATSSSSNLTGPTIPLHGGDTLIPIRGMTLRGGPNGFLATTTTSPSETTPAAAASRTSAPICRLVGIGARSTGRSQVSSQAGASPVLCPFICSLWRSRPGRFIGRTGHLRYSVRMTRRGRGPAEITQPGRCPPGAARPRLPAWMQC